MTGLQRYPIPVPSGGDVDGPASATNNAVALFDGTTGKLLKNSLVTVDANGKIQLVASGSTTAGINIAPGSAPSSPANGDMWITTLGVYARVNGVTQGPFEAAAGSYQPSSGDLTAIDALAGTSGLLRKTATDTWSLDTNTYLTANQSITLSGDATGSGTTSITVAVVDDSHSHTGSTISALDAGDTTTGTFNIARIPTGTTSTTVSLGDHTHSYLSSSTSSTQAGYFGDIYLYDDSTPSHYLQITNSANLTAARTLSINVNDAARTVSLSGNLTVSSAATISGTNTGDQTITLTGVVTGSGTGSFATSFAASPTFSGTVTATTFSGSGASLTSIPQSAVTSLTTDLGLKAPTASPTFTGKVTTAATVVGGAGFNLPHGTAPTTPANGDVWSTTAGVYARVNGVTVGPFAAASGGATWGSITGTLSSQTDLNTALNAKAPTASPTFTGTVTLPLITAGYVKTTSGGVISSSAAVPQADVTNLTTDLSNKSPLAGSSSITTVGTVTSGTWNASLIPGQYGGTGVANTGKTLTIVGGNVSLGTSTYTLTIATTGNTSVTLPTSGTLEVTGHTHTGSTISALDAGDVTTGTFAIGLIPTGSTGTTVALGNHTHSYQPLDNDLTAIAALAGTSGFLKKTATDTWTLDTSTYITANQTITLSGDASGSGTTAITVTVADDSHSHTGTTISALDAGDTTTGTFNIARIPTGTTGSTVAYGDHTHTSFSNSLSLTTTQYTNILLNASTSPGTYIQFQKGAAGRWEISSSDTAESGSNAGSDLKISRYSDAGAKIDDALVITRSTGLATFAGQVVVQGTHPNFKIDGQSSHATLQISGADSNYSSVQFLKAGAARWTLRRDGTETGSNAGSDLNLIRYNDSEGALSSPIYISRATGKVSFGDVGSTAGLELGSSGPRIMTGTGSPESSVSAPVASEWKNTTTGQPFNKTSGTGNTGWKPIPRVTVSSTAPSSPADGDIWVDTGTPTWTDATLTNGWVNYSSSFHNAGYMKDAQGFVHLRGLVKSGTVNAAMFTLPVGYRPPKWALFLAFSGNLSPFVCRIDVLSDGTVRVPYPAGSTDISLEGITFATF